MVVWGGRYNASGANSYYNTGARYDPNVDRWLEMTSLNAPSPREGATAVWTGAEMIVWGGDLKPGVASDRGAAYNPATDTWRSLSPFKAPRHRRAHSAVWTGKHMILFGGASYNYGFEKEVCLYDPVNDVWQSLDHPDGPSERFGHSAIWTGSEMVIWGGQQGGILPLAAGGAYNPEKNRWRTILSDDDSAVRGYHSATWIGDGMLVFGGRNGIDYLAAPIVWTGKASWSGDGLADDWQKLHFNEAAAEQAKPEADPDGDLQDNRSEFDSGTAPLDKASKLTFSIVSQGTSPSVVTLRVHPFVATKTYRVLLANDLSRDPWHALDAAFEEDGDGGAKMNLDASFVAATFVKVDVR